MPLEQQRRYRNRKGHLSFNVLAACNFDMLFTYVLVGWEGLKHDVTVLRSTVNDHGFTTPPGKYWVADAGYSNSETVLVPFRGTRYHLREQRRSGNKPKNANELFNLRHSSLRNVVERIFGVLKRKYRILQTPSEYPLLKQKLIICACVSLHNWVRLHEGNTADHFLNEEQNSQVVPRDVQPTTELPREGMRSRRMDDFQNRMKERMYVEAERGFDGEWREKAVKEYEEAVTRFQEKLAVLVHVAAGQPARAPELLSLRHENSQNVQRNVFIEDRMVVFVAQYHKGFYATNDVKIIHRYVPQEIGELVVLYLWLVLPFVGQLRAKRKDSVSKPAKGLFWGVDACGRKWSPPRFSTILKRETQIGLHGQALNIPAYLGSGCSTLG